jgi:iron complex outermembrane receptor protein
VDVYLSAAWADTEASDVQAACGGLDICEGNSLSELPAWSWSAVLQGRLPAPGGEWVGRLEMFGQTDTGGGLEHDPVGEQDGWNELAVRLGYQSHAGWDVMAYVENANNELYYDGSSTGSGIIPAHYFGPARPRTIGVKLGWLFE